jgi:hypothetical protein
MVREYDPTWEPVTVLLKPQDRVSVYRVGVVRRDVLNEQEYQLLQRARAGEIPCLWCERPLTRSFYDDGEQHKGVRLQCSSCGFDEC